MAASLLHAAPVARAPPRDAPLGWRYVDEARTHAVQLDVEAEPRGQLVHVVESAYGERDPRAFLRERHRIADDWEVRFHRAELETRLGMLGRYWRSDGGLWQPLPRRASLDLRALTMPLEGRDAGVHHFHHPARAGRILLALAAEGRAWLAELEVEALVPTNARVLHPALAAAPLRSLLAREHLRAAEAGFAKLRTATELGLVYGPQWQERLAGALARGVESLRAAPAAAPAVMEDEMGRLAIVTQALVGDPRLQGVHERFLAPGEEEALLRGGEPAILRAIGAKRRGVPIGEQHLLSVLEASLLLRERLRDRTRIDPEIVERVHRLEFYLKKS